MQQRQQKDPMEELASTGTSNVLPLKRREGDAATHTPLSVASIYIVGDGTPENPLQLNVPALTAAIVNSMTTAHFLAIKNGIGACEGSGATGSIGP